MNTTELQRKLIAAAKANPGKYFNGMIAGGSAHLAMELLKMAMTEMNFSARAYDRILKVARTIADLASAENISGEHVSEAIQYRSFDRTLWV